MGGLSGLYLFLSALFHTSFVCDPEEAGSKPPEGCRSGSTANGAIFHGDAAAIASRCDCRCQRAGVYPGDGEFVVPDLLGAPDTLMLGKMMWIEFFNNKDWPMASALTMVLLVALIIPFILMQNYEQQDRREEE